MNRILSGLQNTFVRIILTLSLVAIAFLLSAVFGYGNSFQAQAEPLTPEATQYQVNSKDSPFRENEQEKVNLLFQENKQPQTASKSTQEIGEAISKPAKTVKQNIESAAGNVREKLNLDQPLYPGTES
ncbi:hypothetical protein [Allocoleopsis sp.]|uniref:hypothetical protein n=1 Tax=Allocoleopsis sp. TaxID=3088169 RepID=UPI002FD48F05